MVARVFQKGGVLSIYGRHLQLKNTSNLPAICSNIGGTTISKRDFRKPANEDDEVEDVEKQKNRLNEVPNISKQDELGSSWLNIVMGLFSPKLTPFPGLIGMAPKKISHLDSTENGLKSLLKEKEHEEAQMVEKLLHENFTTNYIRQKQVVDEHNTSVTIQDLQDIAENSEFECRVQKCPKLLRKDLARLLPDWSRTSPISVVTLSQKTQHDMASWSIEMEDEREILLDQFISMAETVCERLTEKGYLADFIDPSCGRPYLGKYSTDTFFETDERYRHLGFTIEDLGCCKVLTHRIFGSNVFIGALFTTAPVNCSDLQESLEDINCNPANDGNQGDSSNGDSKE